MFGCHGCGTAYTSPLYLQKHARYCRGLKGARLSHGSAACSVNSSSSNSNDRFSGNTDHVERLGTSDGSDTCGSRCLQNSDLSECDRQKTHQGRLSGQKSTDSNCLKVHVKTHTGETCYKDEQCGQKCAVRTCPFKQQQTVHMGEKPYVCTDCGYKCTYRSTLVQHARIHTGEKPYVCTDCGDKFTYKTSLVQHARIHTGEKPYVCTDCGDKFTRRSSMNRHIGKKCDKSAHKSNHVNQSTTHTKAEAHSHTSTPGEFSKPNAPLSQNALNLTNEE